MLLEVVNLDELHAAVCANEGPNDLVLLQVALQLAAVRKGLVAFGALVGGGALVAGLMSLQVCQAW